MAKPLTSLIPGIEARLSGWAAIQERLARAPREKQRPTITLSREFGCEGYPLAECLKARMEAATGEPWGLYDKALIEKVALDEGISMSTLRNLGDRSRELEVLGLMPDGYHTHDEAFAKVAKYLIQIAQVGNAIIVGRGGAILCRSLANCYHVRLVADFAFRASTLARRLEMPLKEAEALVKENERVRDRFISEQLGADIRDVAHYDVVFNNARHSTGAMAAAIQAYVAEAAPPASA